jgi:hypothetical protein
MDNVKFKNGGNFRVKALSPVLSNEIRNKTQRILSFYQDNELVRTEHLEMPLNTESELIGTEESITTYEDGTVVHCTISKEGKLDISVNRPININLNEETFEYEIEILPE